MTCPHCWQPGGFHVAPCTDYDLVPDDLRGPGNSQEFMAWLKEKRKK